LIEKKQALAELPALMTWIDNFLGEDIGDQQVMLAVTLYFFLHFNEEN